MDGIKDWAYPSTRIGDAVRFRPAMLEWIYRIGCDPWAESGATLQELCESRGAEIQELLEELLRLPVPDRNSEWAELPVHYLIDFLTAEHREFLHADLPALRAILEMPFGDASGSGLHGILVETLDRLTGELREHIHTEEEKIFPAVLKNEFALRKGGPERHARRVAGRLLGSEQLLHGEEELDEVLDAWLRAAKARDRLGAPPRAAEAAVRAMREFERKLRAHGKLERETLYPIAARFEQELAAAPTA